MEDMPKEFKAFKKGLAKLPREEMEDLIASLWLRLNVEEAEDDMLLYNPDKEVGGADLVEMVGGLMNGLLETDRSIYSVTD